MRTAGCLEDKDLIVGCRSSDKVRSRSAICLTSPERGLLSVRQSLTENASLWAKARQGWGICASRMPCLAVTHQEPRHPSTHWGWFSSAWSLKEQV